MCGDPIFFPILVVYLCLRVTWQVYFFLVIRQHLKNRRNGHGDAKKQKSSDLPEYLQTQ